MIDKNELRQMIDWYIKCQENCNIERQIIYRNEAILDDFFNSLDNFKGK